LGIAEEKETALPIGIRLNYKPQGHWQQKWADINHLVPDLDRIYHEDLRLNNVTVRLLIENIFKACRELADWLWETTSLTQKIVLDHIHGSPALRIADALTQTAKHNVRKTSHDPDPITAWVEEINIPGKSSIAWFNASGSYTGSADASTLASKCVAEWQTFLALHQLV